MNAIASPPIIGRPRGRRWPWIIFLVVLLTPLMLVGLAGLGIASLFHLSSDTRAIRNALVHSSGTYWRPLVGVHANGLTIAAARAGLSFVELEPEARAVLRSARGAEVSITRLQDGVPAPDHEAMQSSADACMKARGWDRIVAVRRGENLIAVYFPQKCNSLNRVECSVVVFNGHELVVASARADLEPMLDCVLKGQDCPAEIRRLVHR